MKMVVALFQIYGNARVVLYVKILNNALMRIAVLCPSLKYSPMCRKPLLHEAINRKENKCGVRALDSDIILS